LGSAVVASGTYFNRVNGKGGASPFGRVLMPVPQDLGQEVHGLQEGTQPTVVGYEFGSELVYKLPIIATTTSSTNNVRSPCCTPTVFTGFTSAAAMAASVLGFGDSGARGEERLPGGWGG